MATIEASCGVLKLRQFMLQRLISLMWATPQYILPPPALLQRGWTAFPTAREGVAPGAPAGTAHFGSHVRQGFLGLGFGCCMDMYERKF